MDLAREQLSADLTVVFPIGTLASAFSTGSTLGTRYAIQQAVPLFADALR